MTSHLTISPHCGHFERPRRAKSVNSFTRKIRVLVGRIVTRKGYPSLVDTTALGAWMNPLRMDHLSFGIDYVMHAFCLPHLAITYHFKKQRLHKGELTNEHKQEPGSCFHLRSSGGLLTNVAEDFCKKVKKYLIPMRSG